MVFRLLAAILAVVSSADELPDALTSDDTCNGASCGLELRQLRGVLSTDDPDEDDGDDDDDVGPETCAKFLERGGCDEFSEVALAGSTSCGDDGCSDDTCCKAKASCDFFTVMGGCAKLKAPEGVLDKVWSAKIAKFDEDLYCNSSERNVESCGQTCCELKPCTKCTGQQYLLGCQAGSVGKCEGCPTKSSCATGQQQTCGDGVFSECFPCKNKPDASHYTSNSMTGACKWECDADYYLKADKCHACPTVSSCAVGEQETCANGVLSNCLPCTNKPDNATYTTNTINGKCDWECDDYFFLKTDKKCHACPTESTCGAGEQQTCGRGILSDCLACTNNKPDHSHYTTSSMTNQCKWECDADYSLKDDGLCHPSTCKVWDGQCDSSHVRNAPDTECDAHGKCDATDCCTPKATCTAYLGNNSAATCALVKEASADGKVWAPVVAKETLCTGIAADDASCQAACCTEQLCNPCDGKQYTVGCVAGSVGTCEACPTNASCASGEYQPCGEGKLEKCTSCTNGPENSLYTDTALENACAWECAKGYNKTGSTCTPTCSVYSCPGKLVGVESRSQMFQPAGHATEFCCQSAGCAELSTRVTASGCGEFTNETECESKYVLSGNQHKNFAGDTIYTECKWDGTRCNWDTHQHRNCVV